MRVLITGATGFLGRQVLKLIDKKHEVYALIWKNKISNRSIQQLNGDILRPAEFEGKLERIDAVVHLAAINKARTELEHRKLFETNVVGTFNVLALARRKGVSKFIFASSAAVYGDKKVLPLKETFQPNPKSIYGLSKLVGEQACMYHGLNHGFSAVCLRISNMYGPYQPLGFVVPDLFDKLKSRHVMEVKNPSSTRDFVYVEDVARAIDRCLDARVSGVINVGSGKETSVLEIAIQLGKFLGKDVVPIKGSDEKMKRSVLDIGKARKEICWEPKVPLEKGLKRTWLRMSEPVGD